MKTIITKGEFARRKSRTPSAISNWIAEGKITPAALIGQGNRARIWVEQAEQDLAQSLDVSQQMAQETPVLAAKPDASDGEGPTADDHLVRERRARALKAEADAGLSQLRQAREAGRWIETHEAQRQWGRELAKIVGELETFLSGPLARELAVRHGLDWKALAVEIRELYRAQRQTVADRATAELEAAE